MRSEGIDINKDKVWRICNKQKNKAVEEVVEQNRGFKRLRQKEGLLQKRLDIQRKKDEYRRHIVTLTVELAMTSYEARRELFLDEAKLLRFAETVMPTVDAQLWTDFKRSCELYDLDLAHYVSVALGLQRHFEEQSADDSDEKLRLDAYLGKKIREAFTAWNETEEDPQEIEEDNGHSEEYGGLPEDVELNIREDLPRCSYSCFPKLLHAMPMSRMLTILSSFLS